MGTHPIFESDFDCLTDVKDIMMFSFLLVSFVSAERFVPEFKYEGTIWPQPQIIRQESGLYIVPSGIDIVYRENSKRCGILESAFDRYGRLMHSLVKSGKKLYFEPKVLPSIQVNVFNCEERPSDSMNEAYRLVVRDSEVRITSESEWGVLHALESFVQLFREDNGHTVVEETFITDFPRFKYRGVLIDTSRHFLPLSVLKAMIGAMSWNKLNVLHWHIVDLDSFPYQSQGTGIHFICMVVLLGCP